jgi:hypothetical protein
LRKHINFSKTASHHKNQQTFDIEAREDFILLIFTERNHASGIIVNSLLWLVAATAKPTQEWHDRSMASRVYVSDIEELPPEHSSEHKAFESRFSTMSLSSDTCWVRLFQNIPIVACPGIGPHLGAGLRLTTELMAEISGATFVTRYQDGLILMGFDTLLVPISRLSDTALQWHLETCSTGQISPAVLDKLGGKWAKDVAVEEIGTNEAYLGWYIQRSHTGECKNYLTII